MTELYRDVDHAYRLRLCDTERRCIAARLAGVGVHYDHVELPPLAFDEESRPDEVIGSYIEPLDRLMRKMPRVALDVASVALTHPRRDTIERELMIEHAHDAVESQLLVHGAGVLFIRTADTVYALACEPGDYVRMPAGLRHWFRMDGTRAFRTIRFFEDETRPRLSHRGADMRGLFELVDEHRGERLARPN
ncbi:acireductone dioxygenase apoprotein [Salinisphaera sp. T5B8]|uniref:hypothetical protein n=1 Tax=unclassified Salinisphaera TaxID=2649847 RepID=UPI00333F3248